MNNQGEPETGRHRALRAKIAVPIRQPDVNGCAGAHGHTSAGIEVLVGAELPAGAEVMPEAALPLGAELPQADSAKARAASISGAASLSERRADLVDFNYHQPVVTLRCLDVVSTSKTGR
jgi:hypothetical protein